MNRLRRVQSRRGDEQKIEHTGNREMWLEWSICAMVMLVPFLYWDSLLDLSGLPRYVLIEVGSAFLVTLLFFFISRSKAIEPVHIPLLAWPVLGFFLITVASILWAHHRGSALMEAVSLSGMMLLFFLAIYATRSRDSFPFLLLRTSVLAGAGIALIGLLQNFGWLETLFIQAAAPAATMINKNVCAQYLDTIIFPAWFLLLVSRSNRELWGWAIVFGLILSMILISYTRGAWLGLLVGLLVLAVYLTINSSARRDMKALFNRTRCIATGAAIVTACVIMALPSAIDKGSLASKLQDALEQAEVGSTSIRMSINVNSWQMFKDHPWGIGVGNWKHAYPEYNMAVQRTPSFSTKMNPNEMHNDPFVFLVELGWIGGLFFIGIAGVMVWSVWNISSANRVDKRDRLLSLVLLVALSDVLAHSLVSFPFHSPTSAMQIWLWLAVIAGISMRTTGSLAMPVPAMAWRFAALVAGLCSVLYIVYNTAYLRSNILIRDAYVVQLWGHADCSLIHDVDKARRLFPYDFQLDRAYAGIHFECDHNRAAAFAAAQGLLRREPFFILNLINILPLAVQQRDMKTFQVAAERLVHVFPWSPYGYHGLGVLAWWRGDYKLARKMFHKALEQDSGFQASLEMLKKKPVGEK